MKRIEFFEHRLNATKTVSMKLPRGHWFNPHDVELIVRFKTDQFGKLTLGVDFIDDFGQLGTYGLSTKATVGLNLYGDTLMERVKSAWHYIRDHRRCIYPDAYYMHSDIDDVINKHSIRTKLKYKVQK